MKHIGSSYKQTKLDDRWDAIVVCGALAGGVCTAAAILGVKVLTRKKKE